MWEGITPTPDPTFMRKLKVFDPKLDCEFNREVERFIITQPSRLRSGRLVAAVVDNPGKDHYRQPDDRDLFALARYDFERKSHKERIREGEEKMRDYQKDQMKKARQEIHERTVDDQLWLRHKLAVIGGLKADNVNPAFRRIDFKPKGYKVKDKRKVK